jgi:hypothetical protein
MARVGPQRHKKQISLPVPVYITLAECYQRQMYSYFAGRHSVKIYTIQRNVSTSILLCDSVFEKVSVKCCVLRRAGGIHSNRSKLLSNRNQNSTIGKWQGYGMNVRGTVVQLLDGARFFVLLQTCSGTHLLSRYRGLFPYRPKDWSVKLTVLPPFSAVIKLYLYSLYSVLSWCDN